MPNFARITNVPRLPTIPTGHRPAGPTRKSLARAVRQSGDDRPERRAAIRQGELSDENSSAMDSSDRHCGPCGGRRRARSRRAVRALSAHPATAGRRAPVAPRSCRRCNRRRPRQRKILTALPTQPTGTPPTRITQRAADSAYASPTGAQYMQPTAAYPQYPQTVGHTLKQPGNTRRLQVSSTRPLTCVPVRRATADARDAMADKANEHVGRSAVDQRRVAHARR